MSREDSENGAVGSTLLNGAESVFPVNLKVLDSSRLSALQFPLFYIPCRPPPSFDICFLIWANAIDLAIVYFSLDL